MNSRMADLCMICALLASACSAAHSAPAPAADCTSLVMMMADCLAFVSEGSATAKPEHQCCLGLKTVLKTDAECLCEAFKNAGQLGVKLNTTKALTLPDACHVSAPSVSNCVLRIGNGPAPAGAPVAVSPSSVAGAPNSVIGANDVSPAPAPAPAPDKSSAASSPLAPIILLVAAVVAASYALF